MTPDLPWKRRRGTLTALAAGALLLVASPVVLVKRLDQDNGFCISCHLHEPHYRGMVATPAATLAGAHFAAKSAGHPERCFTCHSGEGVTGWSAVTALSAWDAARWVLGARHEATAMRLPLEDRACLKCHAADVRGTRSAEETDRYHELADHRSVRMPCVACHVTHRAGKLERNFLDDAVVRERCRSCHRRLDD
jgi:nitrate/TMAO reductase-like tetraheme cytochrome c subunit